MFPSSPARWLAVLPVMAALAAMAQPAPAPSGTAPSAAPPTLSYKSAFEGYQSFADEKPIPWKKANDTVQRRGGWQAYAKEASNDTRPAETGSPQGAAAAQPGHAMPMHGTPAAPVKKDPP